MSILMEALGELAGFALFAILCIGGAWLAGLASDVFKAMARKR